MRAPKSAMSSGDRVVRAEPRRGGGLSRVSIPSSRTIPATCSAGILRIELNAQRNHAFAEHGDVINQVCYHKEDAAYAALKQQRRH